MNADKLPMEMLDALHELTHAYRSRMRAKMHQLEPEVTPNELRMLIYLSHHPQSTHKSLTDHMHADKAQMARTLKLLEERSWIERTPHPGDGRSRVLTLTASGAERVAALGRERTAIGRDMLDGMQPEDQERVLKALRAMKERLAEVQRSC